MEKRALYLSHTGMTEALGRSQVLPYLVGLSRAGWELDLVGFEPASASVDETDAVSDELRVNGIDYRWFRRSPSHSPAVKIAEMATAAATALERAIRRRPRIVHARSDLPAIVAYAVTRALPQSRFIFDCRGLLADEYAESGHWSHSSLRYRALKRVEAQLYRRADAVVTLTAQLADWLRRQKLTPSAQTVSVIPCCVDLSRFNPTAEKRAHTRAQLGLGDRFVLVYSGNLGSYYCAEEMAQLFAELRKRRPATFLVLTRADARLLTEPLLRQGVPADDIRCLSLRPDQMNDHLQAADAGICFVQPWLSKIASSPVKVPEYLALGLPVVMNRGIGDSSQQMDAHPQSFIDAGAMSPTELSRCAATLADLPVDGARFSHRALARELFDLNDVGVARYQALYESLS